MLVGAYFGFTKPVIEVPVRVNQIARHVPEQMWCVSDRRATATVERDATTTARRRASKNTDRRGSLGATRRRGGRCRRRRAVLLRTGGLLASRDENRESPPPPPPSSNASRAPPPPPPPAAARYTHPLFAIALGGILPFGAVCIELFFIMSAMWLHQIYYVFGFLMIGASRAPRAWCRSPARLWDIWGGRGNRSHRRVPRLQPLLV